MPARLALLAALALAVPPVAGGSGPARLLVSANVVRSVQVSVSGSAAGAAALRIQTSSGGVWSADVAAAASTPGVGLSPYAPDPSWVVVTILADAPFPGDRGAAPAPR